MPRNTTAPVQPCQGCCHLWHCSSGSSCGSRSESVSKLCWLNACAEAQEAKQLQLLQCSPAKVRTQPLTAACGISCWGSHCHQLRHQQMLTWVATPLPPCHAPQLAATSHHQTLLQQILQQGRPLQGQTAQMALLLPSPARLHAHWSAQAWRHPPLASASWQGRPSGWRWLGPGG